jgi:hypothetical protein
LYVVHGFILIQKNPIVNPGHGIGRSAEAKKSGGKLACPLSRPEKAKAREVEKNFSTFVFRRSFALPDFLLTFMLDLIILYH